MKQKNPTDGALLAIDPAFDGGFAIFINRELIGCWNMMTFALQVEKPQIAGLFLLNTVEEKIPKDLPITVVFNARQPLENDTYARYETGLAHCEHLVSQLRRKINGPYYVPEDESVRSSERGQRGDLTALNLGRDWIRFLTAEHIRNGD